MLFSNLLTNFSAISSILIVPANAKVWGSADTVGASHKLWSNVLRNVQDAAAQIDMDGPKAFLGNALKNAQDAATHVNLETSKEMLGHAFRSVKDTAANIDFEASKETVENVFKGAKDAAAQVDLEASKQALEHAFRSAQNAAANVNMETSKEMFENAFKSAQEVAQNTDFKAMAAQINPENIHYASEQATNWIKENPRTAACVGVSAALFVVPGLVTSPILAVTGFGANGVVGNSIAAGVHGGIGKVVAGSAFSLMQSAGAGGAGLAVVNGAVQGVTLMAGAAAGLEKLLSDNKKRADQERMRRMCRRDDEEGGRHPGKWPMSKL